ncbi:MAG: hypothetical protein LM577_07180 [Thermoproteaceae archaeon]|nr:hypothetical protein [Thermoproteaceae archaeon]
MDVGQLVLSAFLHFLHSCIICTTYILPGVPNGAIAVPGVEVVKKARQERETLAPER